jgi:hypothetical protein
MKSVRVDQVRHLVFIDYSGVVVDSDLATGVEEYQDLGADYSVLIDLSQVQQFQITPDALRNVANRSSGSRARGRCALIAPTPVAFGLARMYEVFCDCETGDERVRVFDETAPALLWLESELSSQTSSPA